MTVNTYFPRALFAVLATVCIFSLTDPAVAVVIVSGNGNTTAPGDDPGFANVGESSTGNASVTYLGNRWGISARHVAIVGQVTLNGNTYAIDDSQTTPLVNPDTTTADLQLFRLVSDPGLPSLTIGSASPAVGSQVFMAGNGRDRGVQRYWDVNAGTWTELMSPAGAEASGYDWLNVHNIRWGENVVTTTGGYGNPAGGGNVNFFENEFDHVDWTEPTGLANPGNEAIAALGDSGGGVFLKNGTNWELVGLMIGRTVFENQPTPPTSQTSVFGNGTIIADLTAYRTQILAIVVPEPSSYALALTALAGLGLMSRRRRVSNG